MSEPQHIPRWEHFEHRADIGIRGYGATLAEAFTQVALGLSAIITDLTLIEPREAVTIRCEEADPELLLIDWLNELVYAMATRRMLFARFEVAIDNGVLSATAWGEPIEVARHQPAVEVKGATYTALAVSQRDGVWQAQCVVDV